MTHIVFFGPGALGDVTVWIALDVVLGVFLIVVSRVFNVVMVNEVTPIPRGKLLSILPAVLTFSMPLHWSLAFIISAVPLSWIMVFLEMLNTYKDIQQIRVLCRNANMVRNLAYVDGGEAE